MRLSAAPSVRTVSEVAVFYDSWEKPGAMQDQERWDAANQPRTQDGILHPFDTLFARKASSGLDHFPSPEDEFRLICPRVSDVPGLPLMMDGNYLKIGPMT